MCYTYWLSWRKETLAGIGSNPYEARVMAEYCQNQNTQPTGASHYFDYHSMVIRSTPQKNPSSNPPYPKYHHDDGWSLYDDVTGSITFYYELWTFHNPMISHWADKWGKDQWSPGAGGPRSPKYLETAVYVWDDPKGFNNYYRKLVSYPDGAWAHSDTYIP